VEVAELVGEDGAQLGDREDLQQRQAETHHAPAAEAHEAAAVADPGVHVGDEVDLGGLLLADLGGHAADLREQARLLLRGEAGPGRLEVVAAGQDRLEDDECADEQEQAELQEEADGQAHEEERDGEQQSDDGQGQAIEGDHQGDG
jgi:hypothetical protein